MNQATTASSSNISRPRARRLPKRRKQTSGNEGVAAITGGTYAVFADRLPEPHRATAWADAYSNYSLLWKQQGSAIDKLPVHHRGEVLGGLVQSAQRTGRTEEMAQHLDRMLTLLKGTPYEATAQQWKDESRECGDDQGDVQGVPQPGAPVVDARIVAEVAEGDGFGHRHSEGARQRAFGLIS